jgi:hypothetical protein
MSRPRMTTKAGQWKSSLFLREAAKVFSLGCERDERE